MPFKQNYPTKAQFIQACMDQGWVAMGDATALSAAYDFVDDPKGLNSKEAEEFLENLAQADAWDIESRNKLKEEMRNVFRPLADEHRLDDYNIGDQIVNRIVDDELSQDNLNLLYNQQQNRIESREENDFSQVQDALDQDLIIFEARRNGEMIYRDATLVQEEKKEEPVQEEVQQENMPQEEVPQENMQQENMHQSAVDMAEFRTSSEFSSDDGDESVYSDAAENDEERREAEEKKQEQNLRSGLQGEALEYQPEQEENAAEDILGNLEDDLGDYDELGGRNAQGPQQLNEDGPGRNTIADPDGIDLGNGPRDSFAPGFGGSRETTFNMTGTERNALGAEGLEDIFGGEEQEEINQDQQNEQPQEEKPPIEENQQVREHENNQFKNSLAGIDMDAGFMSENDDLSIEQIADDQVKEGEKKAVNELNFSQLQEKISGNHLDDNAVIYEAPKRRNRVAAASALPSTKEVQASLDKFNTTRMFTSDETVEHERARMAAEKLIQRKGHTSYRGGEGLKNPNMNDAGRLDAAALWLKDAADLHQKAVRYAESKNPWSPAGRSRKEGAEQLAAFANKELKEVEAQIIEQGLDLKAVYKEAAAKQMGEARKRVGNMDFNRFSDLPEREQQLLVHDILDLLAGKQSAKALEQNPQNTAGGNFYAVRNAMERNTGMINAVTAYLSNPKVNKTLIIDDIADDSERLMKNIGASLRIQTDGKVKMDDFVRTQQQMAADSAWDKMPAKQNKMGR